MIGIGVQARSSSARLPRKIFADLGGKSVLERVIEASTLEDVSPTVLCPEDDTELINYCKSKHWDYFPGHPTDLVDRFYTWGKYFDAVIRITGDCPFMPNSMVQAVYNLAKKYDYVTNVSPRTFPDGWDCQAISKRGLEFVHHYQGKEREHPFCLLDKYAFEKERFMSQGFSINCMINDQQAILNPFHPGNKFSVDTKEDLERLCQILENGPKTA